MHFIETLQRDHCVVSLVADAARRCLLEQRPVGSTHLAEIDCFVDFFRYYTIACHDPKEGFLFAALERRGVALGSYPLHTLIASTTPCTRRWTPPRTRCRGPALATRQTQSRRSTGSRSIWTF
jgi:hypothetical protein